MKSLRFRSQKGNRKGIEAKAWRRIRVREEGSLTRMGGSRRCVLRNIGIWGLWADCVSFESQREKSMLDVTGSWEPLKILEKDKTQAVPSQTEKRQPKK